MTRVVVDIFNGLQHTFYDHPYCSVYKKGVIMAYLEPWKIPTVCASPGCANEIPNHAWAAIKTEGWFHQKDGKSWCPEHTPEWVAEWRAKNARKND